VGLGRVAVPESSSPDVFQAPTSGSLFAVPLPGTTIPVTEALPPARRKAFQTAKGIATLRKLASTGVFKFVGVIPARGNLGATTTSGIHLSVAAPTIASTSRAHATKRRMLKRILLAQADVNLLDGRENELLDTLEVVDSRLYISGGRLNQNGFDFAQELNTRIRGNLEILRIEQQEEF